MIFSRSIGVVRKLGLIVSKGEEGGSEVRTR
jgi:hypothetical protein